MGILNRELVTLEEWKEFLPVRKYLLPIIFITGMLVIILGNHGGLFVNYHAVIGMLLVVLYTKKKETKKGVKRDIKIGRKIIEVIIALVLIFQLYDTLRYGILMAQIQFQNDGYNTVTGIRNGEIGNTSFYANEYDKKENKVYQHIFEGLKYKSRVDITEQIKEEMRLLGGE